MNASATSDSDATAPVNVDELPEYYTQSQRPMYQETHTPNAHYYDEQGPKESKQSWAGTVAKIVGFSVAAAALAGLMYIIWLLSRHRVHFKKRARRDYYHNPYTRQRRPRRRIPQPPTMPEEEEEKPEFDDEEVEHYEPCAEHDKKDCCTCHTHVYHRRIRCWRDVGPGDLILTTQRPLRDSFNRFLEAPGKWAVGFLTNLLHDGSLGSHIAMIISVDDAEDEEESAAPVDGTSGIMVADVNGNAGLIKLRDFLSRYPRQDNDVRLLGLNRWIADQDAMILKQQLCEAKIRYSVGTIAFNIIPRHDPYIAPLLTGSKHARNVKWRGIAHGDHTCSSLVYALLEEMGFVANYNDALRANNRTIGAPRWHPVEVVPADFQCDDFQWAPGVYVVANVDASLLK